jgi:CxxC motif-containing protein (DUF1111 family)
MKHFRMSTAAARWLLLASVSAVLVLAVSLLWHSPQARVSASSTLGQPISGLTALETTLFNTGFVVFDGTWKFGAGLGPVFTQANCVTCHGSPVAGGGSMGNKEANELFGTTNGDGSFNNLAFEGGPLLQPKSVSQFRPECPLPGEVFPSMPPPTLSERIVTPQVFGSGLIDSIPDSAIMAEAQSQQMNMPFGIAGQVNFVPDENGVVRPGRFGYKAEYADLVQAAASFLISEMSLTSPLFLTEVPPQGNPNIPQSCLGGSEPNIGGQQILDIYQYLIYLAPNPFPEHVNQFGQDLFNSIGCSTCHLPTYTTGPKIQVYELWPEGSKVITSKALSNVTVMLYSDLLLHNLGGLANGFPSLDGNGNPVGTAGGSDFRTTPLWGLSTRTTYLHDGRTNNLSTAILDHDLGTGSEAHQVIQNYKALSPGDQAALVSFIGSL